MKGIEFYKSATGFKVMRIHYTADDAKDPATVEGKKWLDAEVAGIPGGIASAQWRQEMEIDWFAAGGDLVFPQFDPFRHKIVVDPFSVPESWLLFGSFDYGSRNPSSFHVYAIDYDRDIYVVWEYYLAGIGYKNTARAIKACPYFNRLVHAPIADPSIWSKTQQVTIGGEENEMKSIAQLFAEIEDDFDDEFSGPLLFVPGQRGGDITAAERINGDLWHKLSQNPARLKIFKTCPMMIWELGNLRYADWASATAEVRNERESIVDKNNHAFDDLKMFLLQFYYGPDRQKPDKYEKLKHEDPVSYREWQQVERLHREGADRGLGLD